MAQEKRRKRIAVLGGGWRGIYLGSLVRQQSDRAVLVAVAEPIQWKVEDCRRFLNDPEVRYYRDHRELLESCRDLDAVIVATSVPTHAEIACVCLERGLGVFLEKPIAATIPDAQRIAETARRTGAPIQVGFNLRCAPFFETVKEAVASGALGKVLQVNWTEAIGVEMWEEYCRAASYNTVAITGGLLLEKSCHDIDQLNWILGARCERVAAFGSRLFFVPREDLPRRCSPACPEHAGCLFYVPEPRRRVRITAEESNVCVYHCGSDLVDRWTSICEFEDGTVANLNVVALWSPAARVIQISGSKSSLSANSTENRISVRDLKSNVETVHHPAAKIEGHGGADERIVAAFLDYLDDPSQAPRATLEDGVESVVVACAAELSRKERRVVELAPLR